jgi:hypothetical protein
MLRFYVARDAGRRTIGRELMIREHVRISSVRLTQIYKARKGRLKAAAFGAKLILVE